MSRLSASPPTRRIIFDVRHHVEEECVRLARVEEREDVRMLQAGGRPDLGQESFGPHDRGELGLQYLERHFPSVLQVVGQVDGRHTTLAQRPLDPVAALEGCVEPGSDVGHRHVLGCGSARPAVSRARKTSRKHEWR
jgi:hypothetical protein